MSIRVSLHHATRYRYDRPVALSPHEIRLRPAPHCRTPILAYSLKIEPAKHFLNWQQDAYGNWIARCVFPERTREFDVTVDLLADMTVINPFDFFVEAIAERFPFDYPADLKRDLAPFLAVDERGPLLTEWVARLREQMLKGSAPVTVDFLVELNARLARDIRYLVRMEPGVQPCEQTLSLASGSCRDSGWLLVQILRHLGLATRFVSGYLIQLKADLKALDGPSGTEKDFTDLHAWAEVYLPGAGWIGLDPTSGLLAGEGHIPLAATATPGSAAPVSGFTDFAQSTFEFEMTVARAHEDPRVTKPYSDAQWAAIDTLGRHVDTILTAGDVRLTQGGEPTFVSVDDMEGAEWNYTAHSPKKFELAESLTARLARRFARGGVIHHGQGKWYPGESLPRWALAVIWRADGNPLWTDATRIAAESTPATATPATAMPATLTAAAKTLADTIARELGFNAAQVIPAYEDPLTALKVESALPVNLDPLVAPLKTAEDRARLARQLAHGLDNPAAFLLPLKARHFEGHVGAASRWETSTWPLKREQLFLLAGDSAAGYRLPLASLPEVKPEDVELDPPRDPFDALKPLPVTFATRPTKVIAQPTPREVVRTALIVEARKGRLHVFMPPFTRAEDWLALVAIVERAATACNTPVRLEGYEPPFDARVKSFKVTPDPGVIEVNIHPATGWDELAANTIALYDEARLARLATEKFMLDGRHTGTGGGNHVTLGGLTPADSPLLRRPDLLRSLVTYLQNHPALSYLFSGQFIGPTSQAPRVDEARDDALYELQIAFQQMAQAQKSGDEAKLPWLTDRLLRNLLVDLTGNTHRAEFSIDKLYSPDGPTGRLGLLEFRAFEMPPHAQMSLAQILLLRALVARFWHTPYTAPLVRWGTQLHDRFMLPYFVAADFADVIRDLNTAGFAFDAAWFSPFLEFRFPRYGTVTYDDVTLELRQAIEPWNVLGEEMQSGTTARYVDSSVERLQLKATGLNPERHLVACNGRRLPLAPTGAPGEFIAGVRFKAWSPPSSLHPTIGVQAPLVFDLVDLWNVAKDQEASRWGQATTARSMGGCTYHVTHPGGRNYDTFPVNANEAEARRVARFWNHGHTAGPMTIPAESPNPGFPLTLDLRWQPD